ncbi:hypothetical protein [Streptomyces sp. NPDC127098]
MSGRAAQRLTGRPRRQAGVAAGLAAAKSLVSKATCRRPGIGAAKAA